MVPNNITFGRGGITFGDVRQLLSAKDYKKVIEAVDARLNHFLFEQIDASALKRSPFPLMLLSCIVIETLGQISLTNAKFKGRSKNQERFVEFLKRNVDPTFSETLSPARIAKLRLLTGNAKYVQKYFQSLGTYFYGYLRNTLVHGYHTSGIFLSDTQSELIIFDSNEGAYVCNPFVMWKKLKKAYQNILKEARKPSTPAYSQFVEYARSLCS